jgi:hypothetical protein
MRIDIAIGGEYTLSPLRPTLTRASPSCRNRSPTFCPTFWRPGCV